MANAEALFATLVDEAVEIVGSDASSVQVFDHDRGGLRLAGWRGFHPVSAAFWELVVAESASTCGMALARGERVVISDLEAEDALAGSDDLYEYRRSGLRAVQSTPLIANDGRVMGMLSTHWRRPHEPSAADFDRVDALARRCAASLARQHDGNGREVSAAEAALHEVNQRIREMAAQFNSTANDDIPQEYLCECGCGMWIALTLSEFDAGIAAQRPVVAQGHPLARAEGARQRSRALRSDAAALRAEALQKARRSDELAKQTHTRMRPPE